MRLHADTWQQPLCPAIVSQGQSLLSREAGALEALQACLSPQHLQRGRAVSPTSPVRRLRQGLDPDRALFTQAHRSRGCGYNLIAKSNGDLEEVGGDGGSLMPSSAMQAKMDRAGGTGPEGRAATWAAAPRSSVRTEPGRGAEGESKQL